MKQIGSKTWFTAKEIADLKLPSLPHSKRKVNERAMEECWALKVSEDGLPLSQPRKGRGGGQEYHISILPEAAITQLIERGVSIFGEAQCSAAQEANQNWQWFEMQPESAKKKAHERLHIINLIDTLEETGLGRSTAVTACAAQHGISASTLWSWLKLIEGIGINDRLPCLAPCRNGGGAKSNIDAAIWQIYESDYLRPERPTLSSCYRRAQEIAKERGVSIPSMKTFQRKIEKIDKRIVMSRREGREAVRQMVPAQKRTVSHLHALEMVNIDGHKFDVFVKMPNGKIIRPLMVAIQDIYSRKMLSWRIAESENNISVRMTFADLFKNYGIPKECVLDNGRAFASKWITGGAKSRFRFKIAEDEPTGLLTGLGIKIHWAMPYRGQSKPIERAFRDLCDTIAKHPAMAGAYTGNNVDAKPDNYGDKAIDFEVFKRFVEKGIAAHNKQQGRRTEMARGRCFDDVFEESYARAPIGKATEEQLRLALLTGQQLNVNRKTGEIRIEGNRYWTPELSQYHGHKVTVRFDPDNLHSDIYIYNNAGEYLCTAKVIDDSGFNDMAAAKERAKMEANFKRSVKEAEAAEDLLTAAQVAAQMPDYEDEEMLPEPSVVRPVRYRGQTAAALKEENESSSFIKNFTTAVSHLRAVD